MISEEFDEGCETIRAHYGMRHQLLKLAEESAELAAALVRQHQNSNVSTFSHMEEEMADVIVLLHQFMGWDETLRADVERLALEKVRRQLSRISEEKNYE